MSEAKLQKQIKDRLKNDLGGLWLKTHGGPYSRIGTSDIIGCLSGRYIALEVKLPHKRKNTTRLQERFIQEVIKQGGIAGVVTSYEEALELINNAMQ